jgi:hypothetical protein
MSALGLIRRRMADIARGKVCAISCHEQVQQKTSKVSLLDGDRLSPAKAG